MGIYINYWNMFLGLTVFIYNRWIICTIHWSDE